MKRTGILLLTVFYFIVASGFAVHMHYCAGKLKKISFLQKKEDCCCGTKKKAKGCCKEKTIICKINDTQKSSAKATIPDISTKQISTLYVLVSFLTHQAPASTGPVPEDTSPPHIYANPIFLLNRNFRI